MGETVQHTNERRSNFHLDPASVGVLAVVAPGVGYAIAYAHELGWAMQFGIPIGLIAPQLGDVLAATAFLFGVALSISLMVFLYRLVRPSVPISTTEALVVCGLVPVAIFIALLTAGDPDQAVGPWIASGFLILTLIASVIFRSGIFRDRLGKNAVGPWDSLRVLTQRGGRSFWVVLGIAVVVILVVFANALGGEQARNQLIYLVTDSPNPEVELAIFGDTVVLAPFDQSKHVVRPEFDIVKIGPTPLHLRYENVGPLKTDKKLTVGAA